MKSKIKIEFPLIKNDDGYPPFEYEDLWAETEDGVLYEIDNIPLFANQATVGDIIETFNNGHLTVFRRTVRNSGHSLIRVFINREQKDKLDEIRIALENLHCKTERFKSYPIIAVDIPPAVPIAAIRNYLEALLASDVATYEEPIVRHRCP